MPPTLTSSSASAFLLLSQAVFQFDIGPQAAKEVFLDQDGFCAKSFRRSHGGLVTQVTCGPRMTPPFILSPSSSDPLPRSNPTPRGCHPPFAQILWSELSSRPLRMSNPFKLVGLAPHLSLQACLACESKLLPFDNLIGGFRTMAKSPHFYYSMVSVIQTLCDELVVNSEAGSAKIGRILLFPHCRAPCLVHPNTFFFFFFFFMRIGDRGSCCPCPWPSFPTW